MSDAVIIAIVTGVCTALPLMLAQVVGIIKASRKIDQGLAQVNANVTVAAAEATKVTSKLKEQQDVIYKAMEQTNTFNLAEIAAEVKAKRISGFVDLAP